MKRSRTKLQKTPEASADLSFPVSYFDQAKYLALADAFLELDNVSEKLIRIDRQSQHAKKTMKKTA
ncbi:MAG TPA: hypothetical protein VH596_07495 [Terriglobales bacterium]|jgi:hypothetical protein